MKKTMQGMELLTDLYELTMMQVYMKTGIIHTHAIFDMFFRKNPFNSGYVVFAGLEQVIDYLENLSFSKESIDYLYSLKIFLMIFWITVHHFVLQGASSLFRKVILFFRKNQL